MLYTPTCRIEVAASEWTMAGLSEGFASPDAASKISEVKLFVCCIPGWL